MNNLRVFSNEEFGDINVILINNKEYFEAISVAKSLGYSNPRDAIRRHCEIEGVVFHDVGVVTGTRYDGSELLQKVSKKFIDEGNVYRLIIKSKLPGARRFEKWVMNEVLPTIRQNGVYMNDSVIEQTLNNPDFIIQMATKLKEERDQKLREMKRADRLEEIIALDEPYTDFGKKIEKSNGAITIGEFAKLLNNANLDIGRNRLYSWFRDNGYFIKLGKERNIPKQVYISQGLFEVCERIIHTRGKEIISTTTLITGKGQLYFTGRIFNMVKGGIH